jgi:D-arabinose 1-dehydrogenase-like Zn-dependent alcohol dehydrogenase
MTISPKMPFVMPAVMQNIEVKGSTMGSRKEFADMVAYTKEKKLQPVVSMSVKGLELDPIDGLFKEMQEGKQFGKLVVELEKGTSSRL